MTAAPEVLHGVRATYVHRRCRCADCRRANAAYYRRYRVATRRADMSVIGWVIMRGGMVYDPWPRSHGPAMERLAEIRAGLRSKAEREALRVVALVEVDPS